LKAARKAAFFFMRSYSYINSALQVLREYDGAVPFAAWLKSYFAHHKKFGSKDRKNVAHLCYCNFRLGNALKELPADERMLVAVFLGSDGEQFVLGELRPEWNANVSRPLQEKIDMLGFPIDANGLFPFLNFVSASVDRNAFALSHLVQPLVYLRVRPGHLDTVRQKLSGAGISFEQVEPHCLALHAASKADQVLNLDAEAVVQDVNSQRVISLLEGVLPENTSFECWDCCAASGGKSILLHDRYPRVSLSVSDVRESILLNLSSRFRRAGIEDYRSFVADLYQGALFKDKTFDLVLCDAPCSGSGTWGRTPEQLTFFAADKIEQYRALQEKISVHSSRQVRSGGYFLYITCSVFARENEDMTDYIQKHTALKLCVQKYFEGYREQADTLFAALFRL
jgi:16S rRNA (cytosine967-C5)-methyltransferase